MENNEDIILINKYDIREVSPSHVDKIMMVLTSKMKHIKTKVIYINGTNAKGDCSYRQQVKFYDVDTIISHFQSNIDSNDDRFMIAWKRNLSVMKTVKENKILELSND